MKKIIWLVCAILAGQGLLLGQGAEAPSRAVPAPKLGHPLDPADVAVLTGKAGPARALPYSGASTPYDYWWYGTPGAVSLPYSFAPVTTATEPPLVPFFGRFGDRSFVVIGRSTPALLHSPLFFSPAAGGRGGVVLLGR